MGRTVYLDGSTKGIETLLSEFFEQVAASRRHTEAHFKMVVPTQLVGAVIGLEGKRIRSLAEQYKTRLHVSTEPSGPHNEQLLDICGEFRDAITLLPELLTIVRAGPCIEPQVDYRIPGATR